MKEKIKEVLEDHLDYLRESESQDQTMEKINYLSSLIAHRLEEVKQDNDNNDFPLENNDEKKLTERRVKSYGFFKNEYYDDEID